MGNTGPVSRFTARALVELGVDFDGDAARFPLQLKAEDLDAADCIVALKQAEHEPLMRARFAAWVAAAAPGRIAYWQVHDVDFAPPHLALPEIEARVRELIARLGA
jgi:protein-tyrosine phosphatase